MHKSQLRSYYLNKRKAIPTEEITIKSQQITELFFKSFDLSSIQNLHIFLPIIKQKEIDTFLIIKYLQKNQSHIKIIVPKVVSGTSTMQHFVFDEKQLKENHWGILEPSGEDLVEIQPSEIDMVIVPLLIFDTQGNRVGYGKGFYDRFLQECGDKTLKIGVCLEEPINKIEDTNCFDVKLNFCVTPQKIYQF
jgi:5-formyltetrahydrofolate cyclo-ligase